MGCICPCFDKDTSHPVSQTTRLLSDQSSRLHSPVEREDDSTYKCYHPIQLKVTLINSVDKLFQKHEEEFNELVSSYYDLKEVEEIILHIFQKAKTPQTSVELCIKVIGTHCRKTRVNLARTHKYCMLISFDEEELTSKFGEMAIKLLIPSLRQFNNFNQLMKEIQSKCTSVNRSLVELFQEEVTLRKNIMNADLGPSQEPVSLHNCVQNLNLLRRCYGNTRTIHDELDESWNNVVNAYRTFCE
ncbi:uncharacterized protein LOC106883969 isoform X2 [Octopus bimaculoides]|uniref:Uncharacterized protein n=1 Tax=Octopus bimaculoides TaxID=37653 RepID=A0A0L8I6W7_OCTBM|nr:uncharacterized protein LOC106883969 isoform X2 [Octopus bimaculoides]|eukprot:XP_014790614.1 PREDICTED: uncharacterized protein LOC106883969 isoform X2 [Octopus bimaculoides]